MRTILLRLSFSNGWLLCCWSCALETCPGWSHLLQGRKREERGFQWNCTFWKSTHRTRSSWEDTIRDAIDGMDRRGSSTAPAATRPTTNIFTFWIAVRHARHISIRLLPGVGGEHCWGDSSICTCNFVQLFYSAQLMLLVGKRQAGAFFATSDERTACESLFYIIFLKLQPSHTPCSSSPCVCCRVASAVICAHI